jgi:hypothetical protein
MNISIHSHPTFSKLKFVVPNRLLHFLNIIITNRRGKWKFYVDPEEIYGFDKNGFHKSKIKRAFSLMLQAKSIDVYLGRGPGCYNKPGTKKYRNIIKIYAQVFCPNATKSQKSAFIHDLWLQMLVQGFRFFVLSVSVDNQSIWEEASNFEVKRRIGHALRDYRNRHSELKKNEETASIPLVNNLKENDTNTSQNEAHNNRECNQRWMIPLESSQMEGHSDNLYEMTSPVYEEICEWKFTSEESDDCDVMKVSVDNNNEYSMEEEVSKIFIQLDDEDFVLLNALNVTNERSKGD